MAVANRAITKAQSVGFFVLCLLGASGWLIDQAVPSSMPLTARQCLHNLLIALVFGVVAWRRAARGNLRTPGWMNLALASMLLLGVPTVICQAVAVSGVTTTSVFALFPVVMVVMVSQLDLGGATAASGMSQLILPAVAGFGGVMLLLSAVLPNSVRGALLEGGVVVAVVVSAAASVWMYRLLRGFSLVGATVVFCLANAVFFCVAYLASTVMAGEAAFSGHVWSWNVGALEATRAICFDMPQTLLLLWLMREIAPVQFAARYLVIPLLTVVEGYILFRPTLDLRAIGGAALVIFATWRLMTASQHDEEPGLMLN